MFPRLTMVILMLSLAGCVGSPADEFTGVDPDGTAAGNGILEGSVVDENFVPIQGAVISLVGTDHRVETGWNGHFRFTNLQPKLYRINAEAVGWTTALLEGRVQADFATRLTIFLDPLADLSGYSTLQQLEGKFECVPPEVEAAGTTAIECEMEYYESSFPADWAAMLIEVDWSAGFSSSTIGELTAEDKAGQLVYADLITERPARLVLRPSTLHDGIGGADVTPEQGVRSALDIGVKKEPARASNVAGAGATYDEEYQMYVTTFYFQEPENIDEYSALPE